MTPTPRQSRPYKTRKQIDLSPEAAAKLALPVAAHGYELMDAFGCLIGTIDHFGDNALDAELAAFIAKAINELLTPAAPERLPDESDPRFQMLVAAITPETTTELRQLVTTELEAEQRWTAEDIMRREG